MITQNKKQYFTPEMTVVVIDREIALIMMTDPPGHPTGPFSAPVGGGKSAGALKSATPFGGSRPDFSNMSK